ncbi:transcription activator [Paenibacillus sp. TCA20]|uniref:AraC family transcriptional regulator n=1 Tax=Paenibacillus urinalis TaxID=521520 RepID=A0AAX3MTC3_9BACL|nr:MULTISPECIES: AraC family transcriptional regulator [Paenibacillus]WDH80562.1 AraC family transcriptional regulator [Paenibacillus urinalis]GAK40757.1 transcription activator [Paenibacillus sp. TCA20]
MHAWEAIDKTLTYIEEHLTEEIRTETLADAACLSPFYFQRLFKRLVRKPVQEYIKLRRLAKAINALNNPKLRILDVALEYGFSSHGNFSRAFKEIYQMTPEEYKRDLPLLNTFNRPEISAHYVLVDENVPLIVGNMVIEIQKKLLKEPEVYFGLEAEVNIANQIPVGESTGIDIPGQLWRAFQSQKNEIADSINGDVEMAMSHMANLEKGTFLYFVGGLATSTNRSVSDDIVKQILPAGEYVVCRIEAESFEELVTTALNQANKYLFETWLSNHEIETHPFSAEKYYKENPEMNCMEIWVLRL